jgi:mitochondrial pyruvate carrier 2
MAPTSNVFRAARPLFSQATFARHARQAFTRARFQQKQQQYGRRWQSTAAGAEATQQTWFKRMWDSPIGLKTVHFWAPVMKVRVIWELNLLRFPHTPLFAVASPPPR